MKEYKKSVIRDVADYKNALERINKIIDASPGSPEYDELELLTILVYHYEQTTFKFPEPDPIEIILFIMEQNNLKQNDLVGILGEKTNVSKVLNRKRPLTLEMIRKFSKKFNVPADALIQEYELK